MALDAMTVDERSRCVWNRRPGGSIGLANAPDATAGGFGDTLADRIAGEQLFDGQRQIFARGRLALTAHKVLVVNAADIATMR